ncbi:hypothetical protein POTOM_032780 [Populus tomentosa]|uniref:Uncharacterized protein n=1 Tax=Populus tomentosa TaxID=118781 RepID=A0A8X7Z997_POPTO|nr:hypothetical protein POTOM_032780 [Populus tomentosa]
MKLIIGDLVLSTVSGTIPLSGLICMHAFFCWFVSTRNNRLSFFLALNLRFYSYKLEFITDMLRFLELSTHCRDLNPLHNVIDQRDYKEKYFKRLIPLGLKYSKLFPWGGKLTSESLKFFSPIVIWTKFPPSQDSYYALYSAFTEYYKAWLELIDQAPEEIDASHITCNREAQHKYLTWREEKDPGHGILKRLIGERLAKDLVRNFLFNGLDELGSKGFLDYFPEYRREDGSINEKRSIIGKSFENRPWDARGEFIGGNGGNGVVPS